MAIASLPRGRPLGLWRRGDVSPCRRSVSRGRRGLIWVGPVKSPYCDNPHGSGCCAKDPNYPVSFDSSRATYRAPRFSNKPPEYTRCERARGYAPRRPSWSRRGAILAPTNPTVSTVLSSRTAEFDSERLADGEEELAEALAAHAIQLASVLDAERADRRVEPQSDSEDVAQ